MNNDLGIDLKEAYKKHFPSGYYSDKSSSECGSETDYEEFRPISLLDAYNDKVLHCFPEPASKLETKPTQDITNNNISQKKKKQKNQQVTKNNASKNNEPQKSKALEATDINKGKQISVDNNVKTTNSYSSLFTEVELKTLGKNLDKIKHDLDKNKKIKSVIKNVPLCSDTVNNDKVKVKKNGKETLVSEKNVQLEGNKSNQKNKANLQKSGVSKNGQAKENSSKTKGESNGKVIQAEHKNSIGKNDTKQDKSKEVSVTTKGKKTKEKNTKKASVPTVDQREKINTAGKTCAKESESSNRGNLAKTKNASVSTVEQNEVLKSTGKKVPKEIKSVEPENDKSEEKSFKKNKNVSVPKVVQQEIKNSKENKSKEPSISKKIKAEDKNSAINENKTEKSSVTKNEKAVDKNTIETKSVHDDDEKTEPIKTSGKKNTNKTQFEEKTESFLLNLLTYSTVLQNNMVVCKNKKKESGNKSETIKEKDVSKIDNPANLGRVPYISNDMAECLNNLSKTNIKIMPSYCEDDFPPLKTFRMIEKKVSIPMHDVTNVDPTENNGNDLEEAVDSFSLDDYQNEDSNEEKGIVNPENYSGEFETNDCEYSNDFSENNEIIRVINNVANNIQQTYNKQLINTESKLNASDCENPEEAVMKEIIADIEKNRNANIGIIQPNSSFSIENEDTYSLNTSFFTADINSNESSMYLSFSSNDTACSTSANLNNSLKEFSSTSTDIFSIDSENVSTQIFSKDEEPVERKAKRKRNRKKKKKQIESSEEATETMKGDDLIDLQIFDKLLKNVFSDKPDSLGGFDIHEFETLLTSNSIINCTKQEIAEKNELIKALIKENIRKTRSEIEKKYNPTGFFQITFKMIDGKDLSECPINELSTELLAKQFLCGELTMEEIWYFKMGQKSYLHCLKLPKNKQLNDKQRIGDKNDSVITATEMIKKENKGEQTTNKSTQSTKEKEYINKLVNDNLQKSVKNEKKKVANASKQNESSQTNYSKSDAKESSKISLDETYVELLATQFLCGSISIEEIWYLRMDQNFHLHKLGIAQNKKSTHENEQKLNTKSKTHKKQPASTSECVFDEMVINFGDIDYVAMQRVPVEYSIEYVYTLINQDLVSMCNDQFIKHNIKYTLNDNTGDISYE